MVGNPLAPGMKVPGPDEKMRLDAIRPKKVWSFASNYLFQLSENARVEPSTLIHDVKGNAGSPKRRGERIFWLRITS
jgi:hypothetical protein